MITIDISDNTLRTRKEDGKTSVYDLIRKKWVLLTKEEYVRQHFVQYLVRKGYSPAKMAVERVIQVGERRKRFDIVVYGSDHQPWMLVECKEPDETISQDTLFQLLNYQRTLQSAYWVLTNGHQTLCVDARDINRLQWMEELPAYQF